MLNRVAKTKEKRLSKRTTYQADTFVTMASRWPAGIDGSREQEMQRHQDARSVEPVTSWETNKRACSALTLPTARSHWPKRSPVTAGISKS